VHSFKRLMKTSIAGSKQTLVRKVSTIEDNKTFMTAAVNTSNVPSESSNHFAVYNHGYVNDTSTQRSNVILANNCENHKTAVIDEEDPFRKQEQKSQWERFVRLCTTTTMHGVGNIFSDRDTWFFRSPKRMFWLCAVWACTIFSVYEISLDIVHYLDNPVNTIFKVTYVNELTFPAITICNNNQITKSWAMSSPFMRVIQNYYSHPGQASLPMNLSSYNWTGFSFDKLMFEAGHKVKDTVFLCKWKGVSCSVADFTPESTFLGGCFAIPGRFSAILCSPVDFAQSK